MLHAAQPTRPRGFIDVPSQRYFLAYLGLARALMLKGDTAGARRAYQDFFAHWSDADNDIPVLRQAKVETAKVTYSAKFRRWLER
jgi:hypothetical protein